MQTGIESALTRYRLQSAGSAHEALLLRLYVCQREPELRAFGWSAEDCRRFIEQQFRTRNASYATCYPDAVDQIVVSADRPIGRLLTTQTAHTLCLLDIALLPEHRNRGVGTRIVRDLQRTCAGKGQTMTLHTVRDSPARRLYERLGFVVTGDDEIYVRMEWRAAKPRSP